VKERRPLIAGNWKMYKLLPEAEQLALELKERLSDVEDADVLVCVPSLYVQRIVELLSESRIAVGAQNLFWEEKGAFTGEISGPMLKSIGCQYVILGHSERRQYFRETNQDVNKKVKAALSVGLTPILCVGESLQQREDGVTESIVTTQINESLEGMGEEELLKTVIAYEPIWAIGTGRTATPQQANEVHALIRNLLAQNYGGSVAEQARILYGGSVKPENIYDLMQQPDIDGGLVGGASLTADSFEKIVRFDGQRA
jgi:triosephosphate isomerase